jgi:hypothetical protein
LVETLLVVEVGAGEDDVRVTVPVTFVVVPDAAWTVPPLPTVTGKLGFVLPPGVPPVPGEEPPGTDVLLATVILINLEAVWPAVSVAVAVRVCEPLLTVVEFQVATYGELITVATVEPLILKTTLLRVQLAAGAALAAKLTLEPDTVAPLVGLVRLIEGLAVQEGGGGLLELVGLFSKSVDKLFNWLTVKVL